MLRLFERRLFILSFFSFRWFINKKKVIGDYTTEMVIHNATRELHDATVKCEVSNEVGKSEESQTLDIRCKCREREKKFNSPYKI